MNVYLSCRSCAYTNVQVKLKHVASDVTSKYYSFLSHMSKRFYYTNINVSDKFNLQLYEGLNAGL